ncbi:MAG: A24 family peptidase [Verrucomicrobia bacterium]|nr:A24 family peptidase [Verrucomicrobiota bacterium]
METGGIQTTDAAEVLALGRHAFALLAWVLGACVGSFLNVCIYRIPRDESIVAPRSHCPHCKQMIPWYWNIPVLSYLQLRGRCGFCKARITPRYVLVELLVAVLFWLVWQQFAFFGESPIFGMTPSMHAALVPIGWLVISGLVLGTFVDFEHLIIPDRVTLGGIVAGLLLSAACPPLHGATTILESVSRSAFGAGLGWGLLWGVAIVGRLIFRKEAMGFGDVKLMGAIGAFMGWQAVLFTLFISSFAGSLAGILMVLTGNKQMQSRIPYGPYIALAAVLWMFWGPTWWQAYLSLLTPGRGS